MTVFEATPSAALGRASQDAWRLTWFGRNESLSGQAASTIRANNRRCFVVGLWFGVAACGIGTARTLADSGLAATGVLLGVIGAVVFLALVFQSDRIYRSATGSPLTLILVTAFCIAVLTTTKYGNPSYYNLVFVPPLLAAFSGRRRAAYLCALAMVGADSTGFLLFTPAIPVESTPLDGSALFADAVEQMAVAFLLNGLANTLARSIAHVGTDGSSERTSSGDESAGSFVDLSKLTARELETVLWLGGGLTNREIGERMFLSVRTVESHIASALRKTDCDNRTMLAVGVARRAVRERLARERQDEPAEAKLGPE